MSWWNAKYKNAHGEYEITFGSKYYEKTKAVEKFCQAIIDKKIDENNAADILERIIKSGDVTDTNVGNKWISVTDRLPEVGKEVLVCDTRDGFWGTFYLEKRAFNKFCWNDGDGWRLPSDEVTHWMPPPEPPKEE